MAGHDITDMKQTLLIFLALPQYQDDVLRGKNVSTRRPVNACELRNTKNVNETTNNKKIHHLTTRTFKFQQ